MNEPRDEDKQFDTRLFVINSIIGVILLVLLVVFIRTDNWLMIRVVGAAGLLYLAFLSNRTLKK